MISNTIIMLGRCAFVHLGQWAVVLMEVPWAQGGEIGGTLM